MSRASPASQAPSPERRAAVGLYLAEDNGARLALLVHAREHGPFSEVILDVAGPDASRITSTLEEIRRLTAALDRLLDTKHQLTRVLLGGAQPGDALLGGAPRREAPWPESPNLARPPRSAVP